MIWVNLGSITMIFLKESSDFDNHPNLMVTTNKNFIYNNGIDQYQVRISLVDSMGSNTSFQDIITFEIEDSIQLLKVENGTIQNNVIDAQGMSFVDLTFRCNQQKTPAKSIITFSTSGLKSKTELAIMEEPKIGIGSF